MKPSTRSNLTKARKKVKRAECMTCSLFIPNFNTNTFMRISMVPGILPSNSCSNRECNTRLLQTLPPSMTRHFWSGFYRSSYGPGRTQHIVGAFRALLLLLQVVAIAVSARELRPPFSTSSRWVVDRLGVRVKLSCVNWAGHLEAGIPEGLSKNTVPGIINLIQANGFNCVRLTSSTWLWANYTYGAQTITQSFEALRITSSAITLAAFNPEFYLLSLREVHRQVVNMLTSRGLMVILDNHVSKPQWCCSDTDGNGFWGDEYFEVESWLRGLTTVASMFSSNPLVVGIGLRNELRGPRQNSMDWKVLMTQAAEAVHEVNPNVLIIAGGLSYATDLGFLNNGSLLDTSRFQNKLMYEFHWYKDSHLTQGSNFNNVTDSNTCTTAESNVHSNNGFLLDQNLPLILSEFGVKLASMNYGESRFLDCVIDYVEKQDLDWAFWALQGSYYLRNEEQDADEVYGLLASTWRTFRNPTIVARLRYTIQNCTQGPSRKI